MLSVLQLAKPLQSASDATSRVQRLAAKNCRGKDIGGLCVQGKSALAKLSQGIDLQKELNKLIDTMQCDPDTESYIALNAEMDGISARLDDTINHVISETSAVFQAWQNTTVNDFMEGEVSSLRASFGDILSVLNVLKFGIFPKKSSHSTTPPSQTASTTHSSSHPTVIKKVS